MSDSYKEIEKAVAYFEDAVKESDEIINDCSPEFQRGLREQKGHFVVALAALREKAEKPSAAGEIKRNCNSCRFSILRTCETLENTEEFQKLSTMEYENAFFGEHIAKRKFKEGFICDNYKCRYIEYPIEVSKINRNTEIYCLDSGYIGKFVSIRPCGKEYENKTFLGLYLGDLPIGIHVSHNPDTKELSVSFSNNPAIFVFDLNKIIYGCESFWGIIESEADLKQITDQDIDNVWYVKALKQLSKVEEMP